jgi:hypothetical protein
LLKLGNGSVQGGVRHLRGLSAWLFFLQGGFFWFWLFFFFVSLSL